MSKPARKRLQRLACIGLLLLLAVALSPTPAEAYSCLYCHQLNFGIFIGSIWICKPTLPPGGFNECYDFDDYCYVIDFCEILVV